MEKYLYPAIFIVLIILLIVYLYKTHRRWVITVCMRAVVGAALILLLNFIFQKVGISCRAGISVITIPIIAFLGVPGLILIYGSIYYFTVLV